MKQTNCLTSNMFTMLLAVVYSSCAMFSSSTSNPHNSPVNQVVSLANFAVGWQIKVILVDSSALPRLVLIVMVKPDSKKLTSKERNLLRHQLNLQTLPRLTWFVCLFCLFFTLASFHSHTFVSEATNHLTKETNEDESPGYDELSQHKLQCITKPAEERVCVCLHKKDLPFCRYGGGISIKHSSERINVYGQGVPSHTANSV